MTPREAEWKALVAELRERCWRDTHDQILLDEKAASALEAMGAELEQARRDVCDVCLGLPLESGAPCICGGKGTGSEEKVGLRLECHRLRLQVEALAKDAERYRVARLTHPYAEKYDELIDALCASRKRPS